MYAHKTLGVQHFFIDSMMKVIKGDDDYNGQKDFVNEVCAIAQDTGMHIHLIAHVKKKDDEMSLPNKFDVKGSSSVTDLVDNVCIVYRNRSKEKKMQDLMNNSKATPDQFDEVKRIPDATLLWAKQRHYDWEGKLNLWLKSGPQSFVDAMTANPYSWLPPKRQAILQRLIVKEDGNEVHAGGSGEVEEGEGGEPGVRSDDRSDQSGVSRIEDHVSQDW
jgi:twinkle protein